MAARALFSSLICPVPSSPRVTLCRVELGPSVWPHLIAGLHVPAARCIIVSWVLKYGPGLSVMGTSDAEQIFCTKHLAWHWRMQCGIAYYSFITYVE